MCRQKQPPLDLIPIMGLMTLLIPMLLLSKSSGDAFATVEAQLPRGACRGLQTDAEEKVEAMEPTVALGLDAIVVAGPAGLPISFKTTDMDGLGEHLATLVEGYPTNGNAVILTDRAVRYEKLIEVMDVVQPYVPRTVLAGGVE